MNGTSKGLSRPRRLRQRLALLTASAALLLPLTASANSSCHLGSPGARIQHVIYVQFDNTHFMRDNPSVPSDLEQMPHLLNFIKDNGTLNANDHTVLIAHTAGGILSSLTGLYPDRDGQTVSNSYVRTSSTGHFSYPSSFGYWTDPVSSANTPTVPNMVTPDGKNVPAPWAAFTKAGCDVGEVATANTVLENTGTGPDGDITKVFGTSSPEYAEAQASHSAHYGTATHAKAQTDFVGFAIHCARGSALCASGQNDQLPDEPGGYTGFKGLFGAKEINPVLTGGASTVDDVLGNPITDGFGQPGFPGFDGMSAAVSLGYVARMQERGIPVTYAYIADAHDNHEGGHHAFGPGQAGYVQQLKSYDDAFAAFFSDLKAHGITRKNTLFVFTVDEGDHFVGVQKDDCDGVNTPCSYGPDQIGEINVNIDKLLADQSPSLASQFLSSSAPYAFTVHGDSAPTYYLAKKGSGALAQTDPVTRDFERQVAGLTAVNPYTGATDHLTVRMADQAGMKAMHMYTKGDPARNPVFVQFADDNYYITDYPSSTCETCIQPGYAWNHGDIQHQINQTWLGFVGPGVRHKGIAAIWSDHADVRPTMLSLLDLKDGYVHDGRVLSDLVSPSVLPHSMREHGEVLERFGSIYKQLNAPFGQFSSAILSASTDALQSGSADSDSHYQSIEAQIRTLTDQRDALAQKMKRALDAASFDDRALDVWPARIMMVEAETLMLRAQFLAGSNRFVSHHGEGRDQASWHHRF